MTDIQKPIKTYLARIEYRDMYDGCGEIRGYCIDGQMLDMGYGGMAGLFKEDYAREIIEAINDLPKLKERIQELTAREAKLIESLECIASVTGSEEQGDRFWLKRCVEEAQATIDELKEK